MEEDLKLIEELDNEVLEDFDPDEPSPPDALDEILAKVNSAKHEIHQLHRLFHNEYAGRLRNVEAELAFYQNIAKGRAFDDILSELARMYSENAAAVEKIDDPKTQKQLEYFFLDLLQLLENNAVYRQLSAEGDELNPRHCQVVERTETTDESLHNKVAKSLSAGFYIENRTLVKERVHLYVYSLLT